MKTPALLAAAVFLALSSFALAQSMQEYADGTVMSHDPASVQQHGTPAMAQHDPAMMKQMMQHHGAMKAMMSGVPSEAGQGAFAAVQEIVRMLEADPNTDWTKVDLATLRQHLIDMNEVVLKAAAAQHSVEGGVEIAVTGSGRTLEAIRRMIPAQVQELNGMHGWVAKTAPLADGVTLTVTTADPKDVAHIRGLGFIGLLASGGHHQLHHLAMAKGERMVH